MPRAAVRAERCRACGAPVALDRATRRAGWFRCRACRTPAALPGDRFEVFDGLEGRVTVLRARGRSVFVLPAGTWIPAFEAAASLVLVAGVACLFVGAAQAAESAAARWLGTSALAGVAVIAAFAVYGRYRTEQQIEVSPQRLRLTQRRGRRRVRVREVSLGGAGLRADGVHPAGSDRFHVVVTPPVGEPLRIRCRSEREGRWLMALLAHAAAKESHEQAFACLGCAAPLPLSAVERAAGFVTCSHCGSGFSIGGEVLHLEPVDLPEVPDLRGAASGRVAACTRDGVREWIVSPGFAAGRLVIAGATGYGAALALGAAGFCAHLLLAVAADHPLQKLFVGFAGLAFVAAGAMASLIAAHALWGRMRLRVDAHAVQVESLLALPGLGIRRTPAPLQALARLRAGRAALASPSADAADRARHRALAAAEDVRGGLSGPYRIPRNQTLPLILLTDVRLSEADDGCTALTLRTPTRALRAWWALPPGDDARLRHELVAAVEAGLRALGREVAG